MENMISEIVQNNQNPNSETIRNYIVRMQEDVKVDTSMANNKSWRACTLRCGLTILSTVCLIALLLYNISLQLVETTEFWKWMNAIRKYSEKATICPRNYLMYSDEIPANNNTFYM